MRALLLVVAAACPGCAKERREEARTADPRVPEVALLLDSPDRETRVLAERGLASCGPDAVTALEWARTHVTTPEGQRRLDRLIARCVVLSWHTSLKDAVAEATRTGRPILSVPFYGPAETPYRTYDSFFCRRVLSDRELRRELARDFVLHWQPDPPAYVHESFSGQPADSSLRRRLSVYYLDEHFFGKPVIPPARNDFEDR